ncbi:class F sortase [Streptomonospora sediminis]
MRGDTAARRPAAALAAAVLLAAGLGGGAAPPPDAPALGALRNAVPERALNVQAPDGGGAAAGPAPEPAPAPEPQAEPQPRPEHLAIDAIGLSAPVVPMGLDDDGTLDEPPLEQTGVAAWYRLGAAPGETGPAVIIGHRDSRTGPSVFVRLHELSEGDTVRIGRADGSTALFRIRRSERVDKDRFPAARVYGPVDHAALRLITCAGRFDRATGHYEQNLIVYGREIPV